MRTILSLGAAALLAASMSAQIEIRVESGDVKVFADGKQVPDERLRRDGDTWHVLGPDGKEIAVVVVGGEGARQSGSDPTVRKKGQSTGGRPRLGVVFGSVDEALADYLGLEAAKVLQVDQVGDDSAAAKAGIRARDILVAVDGQEDITLERVGKLLAGKRAGDEVELRIRRGGDTRTVRVALEPGPAPANRYLTDLARRQGAVADDAARALYSLSRNQREEIDRAVQKALRAVEQGLSSDKIAKDVEQAVADALRAAEQGLLEGQRLGRSAEKAVADALRAVEQDFDAGKLAKDIERRVAGALRESKSALGALGDSGTQWLAWQDGHTMKLGEYVAGKKAAASELERIEKRLEKIEAQLQELMRGTKQDK